MTAIIQSVTYEGFDTPSAEAVELILGDRFESHLPSQDKVAARDSLGLEFIISKGDTIKLLWES